MKYGDDDDADEREQDQQESALLCQVRLARRVDQLRDLRPSTGGPELLHGGIRRHAEQQAEHTNPESEHQDRVPGHAEEVALPEIRQVDVDLTAGTVLGLRGGRGGFLHGRHGGGTLHRVSARREE
jgi:hypothetical protein